MFDFTATPPLSLYIHIPWCVRKCPYCDFNSHALRKELPEERYVDALLTDLEQELQKKPTASAQEPDAPIPSSLPKHLLVVEDDANERELLSGLLRLYGFEVATCADGNEALAALARGPRPDLVLLDMKMPNCNGQELVDRIRGTQELADLTRGE